MLLAAIATASGILREAWLTPRIGELAAHQAGTVLVTGAFLAAIAGFVRRMHIEPHEALVMGAGWLLCAVIFEFGFGHYVDGLSWSRLLADYDLTRGRLLVFVWLAVGAGPFLLAHVLKTDTQEG